MAELALPPKEASRGRRLRRRVQDAAIHGWRRKTCLVVRKTHMISQTLNKRSSSGCCNKTVRTTHTHRANQNLACEPQNTVNIKLLASSTEILYFERGAESTGWGSVVAQRKQLQRRTPKGLLRGFAALSRHKYGDVR